MKNILFFRYELRVNKNSCNTPFTVPDRILANANRAQLRDVPRSVYVSVSLMPTSQTNEGNTIPVSRILMPALGANLRGECRVNFPDKHALFFPQCLTSIREITSCPPVKRSTPQVCDLFRGLNRKTPRSAHGNVHRSLCFSVQQLFNSGFRPGNF